MAQERDNTGTKRASGDLNPDPVTGAPGSHPVGVGVGAAAAGAAGAAIGSVVPGVGTVIGGVAGAVIGAVSGGYAGKAVAEAVDPTDEAYWRENYRNRSYVKANEPYENYADAYRVGSSHASQYGTETSSSQRAPSFSDVEDKIRAQYEAGSSTGRRDWATARPAAADAYERRMQLQQERMRAQSGMTGTDRK